MASPAWAQVRFDATIYKTPGIGTICPMTLTIGANANRALIVGVHTASATVSSVTGAGATWSSTAAITKTSASNHVEIWVGTNPSAGSQTVTVTFSASDTDIICGTESLYGVNQTSPTANAIGSTGTAGTAQLVIPSAANNLTFALISHNNYFDGPSGCTTTTDWFSTPNLQYGQGTHCVGAATTTFTWTTASNWSAAGLDVQAASGGVGTAPWAGILDPSRAIDWSRTNAGVVGGIPNRTTPCGTALNPGATYTEINSAIAACNDGVVTLNAGTYILGGGIIIAKNNVTLRGAGPNQTFLRFTAGYSCGGLGGDLCFINGDPNWQGYPSNVADWTSGYSAGTTSITLGANTVGSTKPSIGTLLILDQLDDSNTDNGGLWICQNVNVCSQSGGVSQGRPGRGQTQVVRVTAISAGACPCTVTISPGLYMPNWRAGQSPAAWWSNSLPITGSGVENLSMDHSGSSANGGTFIYNGYGIWLKNIRSLNAHQKHVWMYQSVHTTVRDSYFYGTQAAASDSYATDTYTGGDQLIENNIFEHVASPMLNEGGQGTVHAYNYAIDDFYTAGGTALDWQQASSYQHAIGNSFLLWEGNAGIALTADDIHGVSDFIAAFRNYWHGRDPAGGSTAGKLQQTNAIQLQAFNRYYNLIGNILGTGSYHNRYEWAAPSQSDVGDAGLSDRSIYSLAYSGNEGTKLPALPNDPLVVTTLFRWGNYDVVRGLGQWNASEVPSSLSPYGNSLPASQTLPSSFYLSARPAWWGTGPWPGIGPDVTGGNIPGVGGHANKIPAQLCYERLTNDPQYTVTPPVRLFNANSCYPPP
jgi:hypothetical protein